MPLLDTSKPTPSRFVALDRDGTIIVERHRPLTHPDDVELIPGAAEGLRKLMEMGFGLILITNQSGIGRGIMKPHSLETVHDHLMELLEDHGVSLDAIYVCPHSPLDNCECRKPKSGLLNMAAADLDVRPDSFIVIGDKASDLDSGKKVGASTVLVRTGYGAEAERDGYGGADFVVDDLPAAAQIIQDLMAINQHD